ncbi:MAG: HupE/UreJ family protein [Flavobacteriaceae bacterium]|nr:HupE/UreJ family protein [Flavobacteriaceae bacterium]
MTSYINQGFFHVLDLKALDHVLFFIALTVIFTFKDWKKALLLITYFTIGHTLTFGLSVFDFIFVKSKLVEFLIPITILIPLLINIYKSLKKEMYSNTNIYFAFFFGLIHGLGFSSYFLMRIDDSEAKLIPLLKFALGIEIAQIIVVMAIVFLAYFFQNWLKVKKRNWVLIISIMLLFFILPMIIERFSDY